ncbi:hypothetical protein Goklo_008803, partial [Gossypium klotzschianum]|nr:hypothetical protein [Gossypium klotzschianum]
MGNCARVCKNKDAIDMNLSNTEEKFFDSIQWLKSDSEDFFSVNG